MSNESSKHTPGPWYTDGFWVRHQDKKRKPAVCNCGMTHGMGEAGQTDLANARLIAAAPELLEVLNEIIEDCDKLNNNHHIDPKLCHKALAAIAKAEGR